MKVAFTMGGEDLEAPWLALRLESTNQWKREQRAQRVKAIGAQFKVPHAIHPCWLMISLVDYTTLSVLVTSKNQGLKQPLYQSLTGMKHSLLLLNMAIEIVDVPIENWDFPYSCWFTRA